MTDLRPLLLDLLLAGLALAIFVLDLAVPHGRKRMLGGMTGAGLAVLFGLSFVLDLDGTTMYGAYQGDAWVLYFKRLALAAGVLLSLGATDAVDRWFPNRQGEFWLMALSSLLGMTILPGARDLLLLVVCFELMGLPLTVLAAFAKADDASGPGRFAPEAGLKLYLVSAASTAITLYGLSFLYGLSGTTRLDALAGLPPSPLMITGLVLVLAGMAFKIGVVPFHAWIPDTYQGASTPFVAFLSVAPKTTGFAALALVLLVGFGGRTALWQPLLVLLLVASMLIGNLLALPQKDLKRLLGYSGIAQVGYVLMGLLTADAYGLGLLLFYLAAYLFSNVGVFLVLQGLAPDRSEITLDAVRGLARRSPRLALALLAGLLSLAGIPFVVGFWAKLWIFMAAYRAGHVELVLLGALMSIVSLFYYLQIARAAYMDEPVETAPVAFDRGVEAAVFVCFAMVVVMGLVPAPFLDQAMAAARALVG
ncbi:MAG: NADH-quinone oxidoreductase subunit N [Myxococcota bacterium]